MQIYHESLFFEFYSFVNLYNVFPNPLNILSTGSNGKNTHGTALLYSTHSYLYFYEHFESSLKAL